VAPNSVVYSSAISACARSKPPKPEQALELLREAVEEKEIQMSVVGFNAAISACAQAGDFENAISILNRMEEAVSKGSSTHYLVPAPDFVTYGTILAACERGEQWGLVLKYARSMREHGLELDGISVTSCLHACQQLGLADEALQYLRAMKSIIDHPTSAKPQTARLQREGARKPLCGPDAVAYRLAISACARGGSWREGIRLLDEYQKVTGTAADVVAYTSAITGCEYAGQWKEAFYLLNKMRKQGVEPNEVTMAAVIGACATAVANQVKNKDQSEMPEPENEFEFPEAHKKALKLLDILKKDDTLIKPNIQVYNAAIRTCAEAGDMKGAFALFEEIEEANIERTERSYGSLMTACERVGCIDGVSKVFRMMKEDEIMPNEIIYGAAISCCRKAKQSERALLLLRKMMKEDLSPNVATFNTVMVAQAEGRTKGDSERAILVYRLMKSKFASGNGRPNRQTYNILINFFASMYQPLIAESFLKQMREDGFKPDVDLFTATVAAYERTGQPLKALQIMESMQQNGYDFYSVEVLNAAFKKAVKLVNKVGQSLSSRDESKEERSLKLIHMEQEDDDLMQQNVIK
jgi:pentatricopeptide repeat protein